MTGATITSHWIGLNDQENEGEWVWSSGMDVGWTSWRENWSKGGADKNCAKIQNGQWYADNCSQDYRSVCMIEVNW